MRALLALALIPLRMAAAQTSRKRGPASRKAGRRARSIETPSAIKVSATVRRWMKGMTLRDEVAQLVFIPFYGQAPNSRTRAYRNFMRLIRDTKVGGLDSAQRLERPEHGEG